MSVIVALTVTAGAMAASFPHMVGVAPILAALLCASCFLRLRDVLLIGLGAMLLHDAVTGFSLFTLVRLGAVLGVIGLLRATRIRPTWPSMLLGLLLVVPIYHLALATGDWLVQFCSKEPRTVTGLLTTLASGVPYFQRAFVSELLFSAAFLGVYTLSGSAVRLWWPQVLPQARASR